MKSTLTVITTLCVALTVTTFASAIPILTATGTQLPGSLYAWDVFYDGNDGMSLGAAVDLKFEGDINQVPITVFGMPSPATPTLGLGDIDAANAFPFDGFDLVNDSYLFTGTSAGASLPTENGGAATWGFALPTGIDNPNMAAGGPSGTNVSGTPMWMSNGTSAGFGALVIQVAHIVIDQSIVDAAATLTVTGRLARDGNTFENQQFVFSAMAIPEPSSIVMLSMGAVALVGVGLRRRRRQS